MTGVPVERPLDAPAPAAGALDPLLTGGDAVLLLLPLLLLLLLSPLLRACLLAPAADDDDDADDADVVERRAGMLLLLLDVWLAGVRLAARLASALAPALWGQTTVLPPPALPWHESTREIGRLS